MKKWIAAVLLILVSASAALAEKRVALVIGNAHYKNAATLKNPVNDATDIAGELEKLEFDVIKAIDLDQTAMRRAVKKFSDRLVGADVALFYYAGHAVQVHGQNYLAPIDTDLEKESDLDFETVSLELVRRQMEREAKTLLIFLDACRNNPLTRQLVRKSRSISESQGLARLEPSGEGTFIAYATQPDNVALDGDGRNSPFASALLKNLDRPGVEISALMTDVRRDVYEATEGQQLPWTNSSLLGHFFFSAAREAPVDEAEQKQLEKLARLEAQASAWDAIKDSTDTARITAALKQLGDGPYAELANARLKLLAKENEAAKEKDQKVASVETREARPDAATGSDIEAKPEPELIRSIQEHLQRAGCDPGTADGIWGRRSREALSAFSREAEINLASLEPSKQLLEELQKREGRICPLACGSGEIEKDGQCVAKSPPAPSNRKSASATRRANTVIRRQPSSGNCFRFNGKLVCE